MGNKRSVLDEFQYVPALIPAIKEISDRLEPHEKGNAKCLATRMIPSSVPTLRLGREPPTPGESPRVAAHPRRARRALLRYGSPCLALCP